MRKRATLKMTTQEPAGRVEWREWGAEPFARAAAEEKPILLSISAVWCHWCHVMDQTTYADPEVAALIAERYIPIRVDTDLRPDLNDRYNQGGWPTTVFLTPSGHVLYGGTYLPAEQMIGVLNELSDHYRANREEIEEKVRAALAQEEGRQDGPGGTALPENAANVVLDQM